jgi:mono/diheme cytochrome c family protein
LAERATLKYGLARQQRDYQWQHSRPDQGRGRTDTFNPTKMNVFHFPDDGTNGTTDLPAVWNQAPRQSLSLHWDGNNNQIRERNFAAAMAVGATPQSVVLTSFTKVTDYLLQLPSAPYPFPIDAARAARGKTSYDRECAGCHAFGASKVGQTTPVSELGTDRHRLDSFTAELVSYFHEIDMPPFKFDGYRKTDGYSNLPIDGIWARAPYLHGGSVPTLRDLLLPPAQRPRVFYRGYDVYDPVDVGFVSQGPEARAVGTRYDVTLPGNDDGGHLYGTELAPEDRDDLLEYLKSL